MKKIITLLLSISMAISLVSCGSGDKGDTNASKSTSTTSNSTDETASNEKIKTELEKYIGTPKFTAANLEKVDAVSIMKGVKVFLIPYDPANPFASNIAKNEYEILKKLGAEPFIYEGENSADGWIKGIETAMNQGYKVINLIGGADVKIIESQVKAAQDAGIIVMDSHGADITAKLPDNYTVGADFTLEGRVQALYAMNTVGVKKLNCLVVGNTGSPCDPPVKKGFEDTFKEFGAKYSIVEIPSTDWATKIQSEVQNALIADPSINFICAYYDNQLLYVVPALEQLGLNIPTSSFNGSPGILDLVNEGKVTMDIGESVPWTAYHDVDCQIRAAAGMKVPNTAGYAMYFITKDNIKECINPDTGKADYEHDGANSVYVKGYSEIWGINLSK